MQDKLNSYQKQLTLIQSNQMVLTRSQSKIMKTTPASSIKNVRKSARKSNNENVITNKLTTKKIIENSDVNNYQDWLMNVEDASARSDLFQTILWNFVNNASNKVLTSDEKTENFYKMYKIINFYMRVYDNEFSDKGVKSQLSKSRFKLGKEMFNKAQQIRSQLIENEEIDTEKGQELNKQLVEYMNTWMLNEYQWFPISWRKGT